MQTIEPFNLGKRLEQLRQQASHRQFASYQTAKEIAFHLKGTPMAGAFAHVVRAIEAMDFPAAVEALDPVMRSAASDAG
ncbi:MAG TPA: hypothetical protein VFY12_08245 [Arenimonas sp.]|nr:hypothetical protein [Arenimonas sp.]